MDAQFDPRRRALPTEILGALPRCPTEGVSPIGVVPQQAHPLAQVAIPVVAVERGGVDHFRASRQPIGRIHRDRTDAVITEVLLNLADEHAFMPEGHVHVVLGFSGLGAAHGDRVVDLGQLVGEHGFDHDALDLFDPADVLLFL